MPDELHIGIAVTSHNVTAEGAGQFDEVTLRRQPDVPEPGPFAATTATDTDRPQ
jgi:hypothetical protein